MRRASKTDANQAEIVNALWAAGCSVQSLASIGVGCPDLLCGHADRTILLEVKSDADWRTAAAARGREIPTAAAQARWKASWRGGPVVTVRTVEEALRAVGAL